MAIESDLKFRKVPGIELSKIIALRQDAENQIWEILRNLKEDTGCVITDVSLVTYDETTIAGVKMLHMGTFDITLEIP